MKWSIELMINGFIMNYTNSCCVGMSFAYSITNYTRRFCEWRRRLKNEEKSFGSLFSGSSLFTWLSHFQKIWSSIFHQFSLSTSSTTYYTIFKWQFLVPQYTSFFRRTNFVVYSTMYPNFMQVKDDTLPTTTLQPAQGFERKRAICNRRTCPFHLGGLSFDRWIGSPLPGGL